MHFSRLIGYRLCLTMWTLWWWDVVNNESLEESAGAVQYPRLLYGGGGEVQVGDAIGGAKSRSWSALSTFNAFRWFSVLNKSLNFFLSFHIFYSMVYFFFHQTLGAPVVLEHCIYSALYRLISGPDVNTEKQYIFQFCLFVFFCFSRVISHCLSQTPNPVSHGNPLLTRGLLWKSKLYWGLFTFVRGESNSTTVVDMFCDKEGL